LGDLDRDAPFIVIEDLGQGAGSPCEILEGGDPEAAAEALVGYATALGRLHACGAAGITRFRQLRDELPHPSKRQKLYHDPWSNASFYSDAEIREAVDEYKAVLLRLGVQACPGVDDEIEEATRLVEEHRGAFLTLCQGDQNSTRQCIRHGDQLRMIDFGVSGPRHALIEGVPHRTTWGCINPVPGSLFPVLENAYRKELAIGCPPAANEADFHKAAVAAGARWNVFHVIGRLAEAIERDRPRGESTLRQQVVAWLGAFANMSEQWGGFRAMRKTAIQVLARLRAEWPKETHEIPCAPAFRRLSK